MKHLAAALLAVAAAMLPNEPGWTDTTRLPARGFATYYAPGVMEDVARYREQVGDVSPCPDCIGDIAMMRAGDVGRKVYLVYQGHIQGPFRVVDCSTERDFWPNILSGHIVEVPHWLAMQWGMTGPVEVTVLQPAPRSPKWVMY